MFCLNNYRSYAYVRSEEIRSNREFYTREFSVRIWDFEWQWVRVYYSVIFCFVSFNWIFTHELISIKWLLFLCDICTRTCIKILIDYCQSKMVNTTVIHLKMNTHWLSENDEITRVKIIYSSVFQNYEAEDILPTRYFLVALNEANRSYVHQ